MIQGMDVSGDSMRSSNSKLRTIGVIIPVMLCLVLNTLAIAKSDHEPLPKNVEESVALLKKELPKTSLNELAAVDERKIYRFDDTIGSSIRNDWIWGRESSPLVRYFFKNGIRNPGHMSSIILVSLWRSLHGRPLGVDQQITKFNRFEFRQQDVVREKLAIPQELMNTTLKTTNGSTFKLEDFKGKTIVLNMLLVGDPDTVAALNRLRNRFSPNQVAFVGVMTYSPSTTSSDITRYINTNRPNFPIAAEMTDDQIRFENAIVKALIEPGIYSLPASIIIDKKGTMFARFNGWHANSEKLLKDVINEASN